MAGPSKSGNHDDFRALVTGERRAEQPRRLAARQCEPRVICCDGNIITMDKLVNVKGGARLTEQLRRLAARQCEPRVICSDGNIIIMDELLAVGGPGSERLAESLRRFAQRQKNREEAV